MFIHLSIPGMADKETIRAGPAQFGYDLKEKKAVSSWWEVVQMCMSLGQSQSNTEMFALAALWAREWKPGFWGRS